MTHLIVTKEDNGTDEFRFDVGHSPITLGRRSTNDVCIASPSVSGNHAKLTLEDDGVWIEDLNSTNGTFINGELISRQRLNHGDEITIGKARVTWQGTSDSSSAADSDIARTTLIGSRASASRAGATYVPSANVNTNAFTGFSANESSSEPATESSMPPQPVDESVEAKDADGHADENRDDNANDKDADNEVAVDEDQVAAEPCEASSDADVAAEPAGSESDEARATDSQAVDEAHPLDDVKSVAATDVTDEDTLFDTTLGKAALEIRNGAKSGQTLEIDKPVTTLGRPGIQIAAIMRKPDGYFLMHVESDEGTERPTLNDDAIGDDPVPLRSGDELRVAGVDVQFTLN